MKNLFGVTREYLEEYFLSSGEKTFKATQVFEWLYQHKEWDITKFSNISEKINGLNVLQNFMDTRKINE